MNLPTAKQDLEFLQIVEEEIEKASIYGDAQEAVEQIRRGVSQKILKRIEGNLSIQNEKKNTRTE